MKKTRAEIEKARREHRKEMGLKEVRGILVKEEHHEEHKPLIKQYAKDLENEKDDK